jgi:hypothetical protein
MIFSFSLNLNKARQILIQNGDNQLYKFNPNIISRNFCSLSMFNNYKRKTNLSLNIKFYKAEIFLEKKNVHKIFARVLTGHENAKIKF